VRPAPGTGFANVEEDFADEAVWSMNLLAREGQVLTYRGRAMTGAIANLRCGALVN
jgi:hypothetical protein